MFLLLLHVFGSKSYCLNQQCLLEQEKSLVAVILAAESIFSLGCMKPTAQDQVKEGEENS
jgi:hypothetical protein